MSGRLHGRKGRFYFDPAGGGAASPLPFVAKWTLQQATDKAEVTAMGDTNKIYVSGMPDASGSVSGFYDDSTAQTYTAAIDGLARKFYLYPSILTNTQYWFGTAIFDITVAGGVDGPVTFDASWSAASDVAKVG
jgi:hypothetical protein